MPKIKSAKRKKLIPFQPEDLLHTGSLILNLAISGDPGGGLLKGRYHYFVGDSSSGKAQPLESKILTPNGWVEMGSICKGDVICDPNGGISQITGVFPQGEKEAFNVEFSDGTSCECCGEHLWTIQTANDKARSQRRTVPTNKMKELLNCSRIYIPSHQPVELHSNAKNALIQPYLMGVLLGDGCFRGSSPGVSNPDKEIIDKVKSMLPTGHKLNARNDIDWSIVGYLRNKKGSTGTHGRRNLIKEELVRLQLWGLYSHEKFIPREYIYSSFANRLELLRGLMDTDGDGPNGSSPIYNTSSNTMAEQVMFLVRSLGGVSTKSTKQHPKYTYRGKFKTGKPAYRIRVSLPNDQKAFHLNRKIKPAITKIYRKRVVSIESVGIKECQCISTSSKEQLYFTDGMIVTHNTFFTLAALAEASINPEFDEYRLIYDDVEGGALMDIEEYFGPALADRIEPPSGTKEEPSHSEYIEDLYFNLDDAFNKKIPFIYICDSQDSLDSLYSEKKFQELKTAKKTGAKAKGDYGDGKAKFHSTRLRSVVSKLRASGSILIIVNQTRAVISDMPFGPKSQASGGWALKFYAAVQIWTSVKGKLYRSIHGNKRQIGIEVNITIKKNRISGKEWTVTVPIYWSHGIDNIGSCVNFLVAEKRWKRNKDGVITASDFDGVSGNLENVIQQIEGENLDDEVFEITEEVFEDISKAASVKRKNRYHRE